MRLRSTWKAVAGEEGGGGGWQRGWRNSIGGSRLTSKTTTRGAKRVFWGGMRRREWRHCILALIVRGHDGRPLRQCGVHTAIRMAPFNMAGVAGLLATCAAVAASAAHLLPLLLLLICPRGIQADQGKRSFVRFPTFFYPTFCCLRTYVGLIKPRW